MAGKVTGTSKKNHHASYKAASKWSTNRARKLKRHLKNHPNDAVAQEATASTKTYGRKTPGQHKVQGDRVHIQLMARLARYYTHLTTYGHYVPKLIDPVEAQKNRRDENERKISGGNDPKKNDKKRHNNHNKKK